MASYDFFSQPQGITVPISIFGAADAAGVAAGNAQKTTTQAISEGIQGAIKGYLGTEAALQENEIRAAQIEQIPVQAAQEEERLEALRQQNEIRQKQIEFEKQNQELIDKAKLAKLNYDTATLTQANADIDTKTIIDKKLASTNSADRLSILQDPRALRLFSNDPKYAEFAVGVMDQRGDFRTEEERDRAWSLVDFSKAREFQARVDLQNAKDQEKIAASVDSAADAFNQSSGIVNLPPGLTLQDKATKLSMYPRGQKQVDSKGRIIKGDDVPASFVGNEYDVFLDGVKQEAIADKEGYKAWGKLRDAWSNAFKGTQLRRSGVLSAAGGTKLQQATGMTPASEAEEQSKLDVYSPFTAQEEGAETKSDTAVIGSSVIKRSQERFKEKINTPPEGLSGTALERRYKMQRSKLKAMTNVGREVSKRPPVIAPTPETAPTKLPVSLPSTPLLGGESPAPSSGVNVSVRTATPVPALEDINTNLSQALRYPAQLKTNVIYSPNSTTWNRVNSNPLTESEPALIKGMITIESQGIENAESPTKVKGLMQVTRPVAKQYGLDETIPEENLLAGKKYILGLLEQFDGNLRLALTAYNAGPGTVNEAIRATGSTDWPIIKEWLRGHLSIDKFKEVENYADNVISAAAHYMTPSSEADQAFAELMMESGVLLV